MNRTARISSCSRYRYELTRTWGGGLVLSFVMLNPSTADANIDDATIRRCLAFAKRDSYGGIRVVNLFAYRATEPSVMAQAADPVGPENDAHLLDLFMTDRPAVVAAWGAGGGLHSRDFVVRRLAHMMGVDLLCLGTTQNGSPRHPLYVRGDQPLVPLC